jgi:hypothetical protein
MTTALTKPVTRFATREGLVVTLTAEGVTIREPRKRFTYGPVSYGHIQLIAARALAEEHRKAKAQEKAARKAARASKRRQGGW